VGEKSQDHNRCGHNPNRTWVGRCRTQHEGNDEENRRADDPNHARKNIPIPEYRCSVRLDGAAVLALPESPYTRLVLSRRQKIGLLAVAVSVVLAAALSVAQFAEGHWVQGTVWAVWVVAFTLAYGITVVRVKRA
jgi:hypothetical protein